MKNQPAPRSKEAFGKQRRKRVKELKPLRARDRQTPEKHRGHAPGSRAAGGNSASGGNQNQQKIHVLAVKHLFHWA